MAKGFYERVSENKPFFKNFRDAEDIISDSSKNPYSGLNLPHPVDNELNSKTWKESLAIPFTYKHWSDADETTTKRGILYIPAYESTKIYEGKIAMDDDIDVYGAEVDGQSLDRKGLEKLVNNYFNWDFKLDGTAGKFARAYTNAEEGKTPNKYNTTHYDFKAQDAPFIKNLRKALWGRLEKNFDGDKK